MAIRVTYTYLIFIIILYIKPVLFSFYHPYISIIGVKNNFTKDPKTTTVEGFYGSLA